jgi:hypothetical protein
VWLRQDLHKLACPVRWTEGAVTRDAVVPMFMLTLHFMQPPSKRILGPEVIDSMITGCAVPEDRVEHVYVQAGDNGQVDVVIFLAATDLAPAMVNATALTSRLLWESFSGWLLLKACVENVA